MIYPSREFDDAVASVLAERETEEQSRALGELLRCDAAARTAYLWQTELHGRLLTRDEFARHVAPLRELAPQPARGFSSRGAWLALAAAVVLLATLAWVFLAEKAPVRVMAEVLETTGGNRFHAGQRAELTELKCVNGTLRLRLESGVVMDCAAPFEARFENHARLRLVEGRLNVDVGERGFGFTVVTAAGEVVDLGTAFGIEAMRDGRADVVVLSGKVEVRQGRTPALALVEGEGIRMKRGRKIERLQSVRLTESGGTIRFGSQTSGANALVADVSDNLLLPGLNRYYAIVPGGMRAEATAFADRVPPRWLPLTGDLFPPALEGGDLIQTFHEQRQTWDFQMQLQLKQPALVYVLHDPRHATPEWLQRDFKKTTMRLSSGPWPAAAPITVGLEPDDKGQFFVTYQVWQRRVTAPGTLMLGAPFAHRRAGLPSMYGLVVKPLNP